MSEVGSTELPRTPALFALLPCPIKTPIERAFGDRVGELPERASFVVEGNANHDPTWSRIASSWTDIGDFPDIIIFPGVNFLHGKNFRERFIDTGHFAVLPDSRYSVHSAYRKLCVNPLVIAYNTQKLAGKKIPRGFADLADKSFARTLLLRGKADQWCEATLLGMSAIAGDDGIQGLARSTLAPSHPAEMVKRLYDPDDQAAVCVLPYFFAKQLERKAEITVLWPVEGAIASPVTMLVKANAVVHLEPVWQFFVSDEASNIYDGAFLPSLRPGSTTSLPKDGILLSLDSHIAERDDLVAEMNRLQLLFRDNYASI